MIAEGDTYMKYPDDETYPQLIVNYLRLDAVPRFDAGWPSVLTAMRAGDYFVTSGEMLFRSWSVEGSGPHRIYSADVEWTFPPEFAELVWGDGKTTSRQKIPLTGMGPFSSHHFQIPFRRRRQKVGAFRHMGLRG